MRLRGCPIQRPVYTRPTHAFWFALWVAVFLGMLAAAPTSSAPAQDTSTEEEAKTRLSKEELLARLQGGERVQNSIIQGDDLIAILRERTLGSTVQIAIMDSVIEGGLDFTTLPATPVEQLEQSKLWNDEDRRRWLTPFLVLIEKIYVVENPITITGSTIFSGPERGLAVMANMTLFQQVSFRGTTFSGGVSFESATFNAEAGFESALFSQLASFQGATFRQAVSFEGSTFSGAGGIFKGATFRQVATFNDATFTDAVFEGATFRQWVGFRRTTFEDHQDPPLTFNLPGGVLSLHPLPRKRKATFNGATFGGWVLFHDATFRGEAAFEGTTFSGEAGFLSVTFREAMSFTGARFTNLAFFKDARFFGRLTLDRALFETYADFRNAQIQQLAVNNAASPQIISARMDFRHATITEAHLQDIVFGKDINFSDTRFGVAVDAARAHQQGSQIAGPGAPRAGQAKCPQVAPDVATVFRFITFEGHAYFLRTAFCGRTSLERVIFHKDANFTDATFQDHQASGRPGFSLSYVNFTTLRLKWSQLAHPASWVQDSHMERIQSFLDREDQAKREEAQAGNRQDRQDIDIRGEPHEPLSEVLKSLEANFRRQNELGDANEAYYQMKRAELREARERQSFLQRLPREIEWMSWGIFCGYGTGIWTVVSWTVGVNILFTLIYWTTGHLQRHRDLEITRDFTFKWRLFDFPHAYITPKDSSAESHNTTDAELLTDKAPTHDVAQKLRAAAQTFWNALRFSSGILFKIGYRDTTVSGHIGKCNLRWIVWVEWVLGFILLAFLIYTWTNTQPLLYKLIHGIF